MTNVINLIEVTAGRKMLLLLNKSDKMLKLLSVRYRTMQKCPFCSLCRCAMTQVPLVIKDCIHLRYCNQGLGWEWRMREALAAAALCGCCHAVLKCLTAISARGGSNLASRLSCAALYCGNCSPEETDYSNQELLNCIPRGRCQGEGKGHTASSCCEGDQRVYIAVQCA